ncbi:hypothetical protein [Microlunatus ginsengisoli]
MNWSLDSPVSFVGTHGRLIDRRRLGVMCGGRDAAGPIAALDAYRSTDGGYGWSLEPDHRSAAAGPMSQLIPGCWRRPTSASAPTSND